MLGVCQQSGGKGWEAHEVTLIILARTPVDFTLEIQEIARELATAACLRHPPSGLRRVQSVADQKDRARKKAVQEWAQDCERTGRAGGGR